MKKILLNSLFLLFIGTFVLFVSCNHKSKNTLFTQLSSAESGIHFSNDVQDTDSSKSFINEFGYMGGGVGIGDFNNDGLKDIFFSGNQLSCRLYINKGNNQFEDITEKAGIKTDVWCTGVSIVDINNDGYDDIYVCVLGKDLLRPAKNLLFINQHNLTFKEEAEEYGLADLGNSTQAVFLDYDKDGDLDMFLVNYLLSSKNGNTIFPIDKSGKSLANDRLYRNDGIEPGSNHPVFHDVSLQANIKEDGYGLSVVVSDFNNDGWPDIYVANDFLSNDELWLNNRNGTFTNVIGEAIQHQSYSSMGADAADINNDGLPDIVTLDMLPESNERKKTSFSFMNYDRYEAERAMGYEPEFMRNMLQLNDGTVKKGDTSIPFFSEIGQLAGIQATDWSWSILMADFNNDGLKDMHITNGIGRDFIDADFLAFSNKIFTSNQTREEQEKTIREKLASLNHVNLPDYLYINNGNYTFSDQSQAAGINKPGMSNGATYVDLDNDGDLDLVVNNLNQEASVFINNTNQKNKPVQNHFLSIRLQGDSLNNRGFGTKVFLYDKSGIQMQEENPVRGYFSSVDRQLLFGLGKNQHIDSLVAIWPDNKKQIIRDITPDSFLILSWKNAINIPDIHSLAAPLFTDKTESSGILYRHQENDFDDYSAQTLLPHKYSQLGPFIATADINQDGRTDFFIGGGFNYSGKIFTQKPGQTFVSKNLTDSIKMQEDMGCIFFDANGDGYPDLLVTCGDVLYEENSIYYKPRLYLNDGKGKFTLNPDAIPDNVRTIAGCVSVGDYNGDGKPDIFIGGRVSKTYPLAPHSFILENEKGVFKDVTAKVCPDLQNPGMVTSAIWIDFDNDRQLDLVIAGEWMPIRFFRNNHGTLKEVTTTTGLENNNGMWRSLIAADIDNDGDLDLIAGNLGLNCDYRVSPSEPMELFSTDMDDNGSIDPILFYYIKDKDGNKKSFPAISRDQFAQQVPGIKKKFLLYKDYGKATFEDLFDYKAKKKMRRLHCDETRSCWFENLGYGKFKKHPLPMEAQFAPVNAIICDDLDGDGFKDLLIAGNDFQTDVITGRYDASYGCYLKGNRNKTFTSIPAVQSGFIVKGDVKDMAMIKLTDKEKLILVAINNDSMRVFSVKKR
jgi:enediyne biosynthesis protein E4